MWTFFSFSASLNPHLETRADLKHHSFKLLLNMQIHNYKLNYLLSVQKEKAICKYKKDNMSTIFVNFVFFTNMM